MTITRIDALTQFTNEAGETWSDTEILPENFLVHDTTTNIIKKGNGVNIFDDLPIWLDLNVLENIYNTVQNKLHPDIFEDEGIDTLLIITSDGKVHHSDINYEEFENWVNTLLNLYTGSGLDTYPRYSTNILSPVVTGYNQYYINGDLELTAQSISFFGDTDELIYHWHLPDGNDTTGQSITYTIPDNPALINTTLTFTVYAMSKTTFRSYETIFEVIVKGSPLERSPSLTSVDITKIF